MARIDIGHITLNFYDKGEGDALIFIPGLVGLYDAWSFQLDHFAERYRCITFDHRGCGDSDKPTEPGSYTTQMIAKDVIGLMDTVGIEKAHVVGTSTGGCILQNLALDHPNRLRACIFNNTWVIADEFITRVALTRKRIAESYGPEEYVKVSSMFTSGADQFRHNLDAVMELERRALDTIGSVEILTARLDMMLAHNRKNEISQIDKPALVIGTIDDATIPYYFAEDLNAAIPGSEILFFDDGGHYSYRRHPEKWNTNVQNFLDNAEATI
ncbi:MAG: alpha/beta hydrolase [Alphaproteobacteria bacterium]|jgi:aminoacrylate hydrolase|nr:alpha/beta hydrolase [Alphaproteobacteria bacterium]